MTVSRTRGSQHILHGAGGSRERFERLVPVVEDWHAEVCMLEVCLLNKTHVVHVQYNNHILLIF